MRFTSLLLSFFLFLNLLSAQLPDEFEIASTVLCPVGADGTWTRHTGPLGSAAGSVLNTVCGCYNHEADGFAGFLLIVDMGANYEMRVYLPPDGIPGNGCGTATMTGSFLLVARNDNTDCVLNNFDGSDNGAITGCIYTFSAPEEAIPTLSQWGIILLGFSFLIIGMVAILQRKFAASTNLRKSPDITLGVDHFSLKRSIEN